MRARTSRYSARSRPTDRGAVPACRSPGTAFTISPAVSARSGPSWAGRARNTTRRTAPCSRSVGRRCAGPDPFGQINNRSAWINDAIDSDIVEMREIEAFLAVADDLPFGRAAQRLHVTTASVSQAIRALERRVGGPLFERTSRQVALTPIGVRLRAGFEPAYEQLRASLH